MLSDDDLLCLCEFAERNVGGFLSLEAVDLLELVFEIYCLREENDRLRAGRLRPETVFKIRDTLTDYREELRAIWEGELAGMRVRIKQMRQALQTQLAAAGVKQDISFITRQKGMFSYSGLNKEQMQRLRNEFGIYGVDSGRICVAALNSKNIDSVVAAIAKVS